MHTSELPKQDNANVGTALLEYLRERPNAADTLTGISRWWWERQAFDAAQARVRDALAALVRQGHLSVRSLPGGELLYMLAAFGSDPPPSTPAPSTPALSTPALSTPALSTPAPGTPTPGTPTQGSNKPHD